MALLTSPEKHSVRKTQTLHILSNFAVGDAELNDYWRAQLNTWRHKACAFSVVNSTMVPVLTLPAGTGRLFDTTQKKLDLWPTWCSFFTEDGEVRESFLLLSIITETLSDGKRDSQKDELVLRFQYPEHLELVERIAQTGELRIAPSSGREMYMMPLLDPELSQQIEYIRPLFR